MVFQKKKQDKVIDVITKLFNTNILKKNCNTKAEYKDSQFIYLLQNKDKNRRYFFNNKQIKLNEHKTWYKKNFR